MNDDEFRSAYPDYARDYQKHVDFNGRAYGSTPNGESQLSLVFRTKWFFGSLLNDFEKKNPVRHVVAVSHGVTVRGLTMSWMHYPPEWLDAERNPSNCWVRHIHGTRDLGYIDEGYIYGEGAPLRDPDATQTRPLTNPETVYMLKPVRPNGRIPPGVKVIDPFAKPEFI